MGPLYKYKHPFIVHDEYEGHSAQVTFKFDMFNVFVERFKNPDPDNNLIVHFDITKITDEIKEFYEVFIVHKSKGVFRPMMFEMLDDYNDNTIRCLLASHWEVMKKLWIPFSDIPVFVCNGKGTVEKVINV